MKARPRVAVARVLSHFFKSARPPPHSPTSARARIRTHNSALRICSALQPRPSRLRLVSLSLLLARLLALTSALPPSPNSRLQSAPPLVALVALVHTLHSHSTAHTIPLSFVSLLFHFFTLFAARLSFLLPPSSPLTRSSDLSFPTLHSHHHNAARGRHVYIPQTHQSLPLTPTTSVDPASLARRRL